MRVPDSALAQALGFAVLAWAVLGGANPAAAKPSEAQIADIKANCRSDFMSNCWGVKRGGIEAVQCLEQHMSSLSPGCAKAVKAIAAAPPKAPAPAAAEAKPESAPAAEVPPAAAKTAAPAEPKAATTTEAAPAGTAATAPAPKASATLTKPAAKTQSGASAATSAPTAAKGAQSAAKTPSAPASSAAEPAIIGFIPPRKKLMVKHHCKQDLETYCADVSYGDGRLLHCLFDNKASLSSDCRGALANLER
jgi:outer membrane biosynthesis protein TonB